MKLEKVGMSWNFRWGHLVRWYIRPVSMEMCLFWDFAIDVARQDLNIVGPQIKVPM